MKILCLPLRVGGAQFVEESEAGSYMEERGCVVRGAWDWGAGCVRALER
jgi:hypothetical protein